VPEADQNVVAGTAGPEPLIGKLGKHKMTKSCLYLRQLADIDKSVLEQLVAGCIAAVKRRYR
jgi:hypothetical protein